VGRVKDDFLHGMDMLSKLTPHPRVAQPLGMCESTLELVTLVSSLHFNLEVDKFVRLCILGSGGQKKDKARSTSSSLCSGKTTTKNHLFFHFSSFPLLS
jgi:hypothetical protein